MKEEKINAQLKKHEMGVEEWELNDVVRELHRFFGLYNKRFFDSSLTIPAIGLATTRYDRRGHYMLGRNAFGLRDEININRQHLNRHPVVNLMVLLHEMIHMFQHTVQGCGGYHNKQFHVLSTEFGMPTHGNRKGIPLDIQEPLISFLRQHLPLDQRAFKVEEVRKELLTPVKVKGNGKSTLKKWSCGCRSCRVGLSDFNDVLCRRCNREFVRG